MLATDRGRRILRYTLGVMTGIALSQLVGWQLSYIMPILLVVTVPARVIVNTLEQKHWAAVALSSAVIGLVIARAVFVWSLGHYRSASS